MKVDIGTNDKCDHAYHISRFKERAILGMTYSDLATANRMISTGAIYNRNGILLATQNDLKLINAVLIAEIINI